MEDMSDFSHKHHDASAIGTLGLFRCHNLKHPFLDPVHFSQRLRIFKGY
jgi:hypothetical protein